MDVPAALALQKRERFLRASRADIKESLGMDIINWSRVCPGVGAFSQVFISVGDISLQQTSVL
jgi:hypothetical protein